MQEEISTSPSATLTDDEWEASTTAPTLMGPSGLFRTMSATHAPPLHMRVGLHVQGFQQDCFLISGSTPGTCTAPGDSNSRFQGDLTIGLTGPDVTLLRNLEFYFGVFNSSNENIRTDPGRTDPQVILGLGDVAFGLKGGFEATSGLDLGLNFGLRFFNSISGETANFDATNITIDGIATFDVRKFASSVPLRFHLNVGYIRDPSLEVMLTKKDAMGVVHQQCENSTSGTDPCIHSRVVETFAYGLGVSRVRLALAVEAPLRPHAPWGVFGITPFIEYHLEDAIGDGDTTVANALTVSKAFGDCSAAVNTCDRINSGLIQYITAGVRLRPAARLVIDLGADFGLTSPGFRYGPPIPVYNIIGGLSYSFDPGTGGTKVIKRTITRTQDAPPPAPRDGHIRGVVRDSKTKKAIAGALVRYPGGQLTAQSTGSDGGFVSYGMPSGAVKVEASRGDDYESATAITNVETGGEATLEILLTPKPPKEGKLHIRGVDEKGAPILGGTARASNAMTGVTRDGATEQDGWVASLPAGEYQVSIDSPNYLSKEKTATVSVGQDKTIELTLRKRPAMTHVTVTKDAIVIKGTIHFGVNNAVILPDGQQILDEVADALAKNPQIHRVSIEGHTDNKGPKEKNQKLSQDRAESCRNYLIKQGVSDDRLTATGFGPDKPLVPNLTLANRAKNRRVEFKIVDQGAGAN